MRRSLRNPFSPTLPSPTRRHRSILAVPHGRAARRTNGDTEAECVRNESVSPLFRGPEREAEEWLRPPSLSSAHICFESSSSSITRSLIKDGEGEPQHPPGAVWVHSNDNVVCYTLPAIWLRARREDKRPKYKENFTSDISPSMFHLLADSSFKTLEKTLTLLRTFSSFCHYKYCNVPQHYHLK